MAGNTRNNHSGHNGYFFKISSWYKCTSDVDANEDIHDDVASDADACDAAACSNDDGNDDDYDNDSNVDYANDDDYDNYMASTFSSQFVSWEYNGELVPGSSFIKVGKLVTTAISHITFRCQWENL